MCTRTFGWLVWTAVAAWLVALAIYRPISLAGDPMAVYFPIVQNLSNGGGVDSFGPLWVGSGRQPLFPLLLAVSSLLTSDLIRAGQIVGVAGALTVIGLCNRAIIHSGGGHTALLGCAILIATSYNFARSSLESLPDMAFLALYGSALLLLTRSARLASVGGSFVSGVLGGLAFLVRLNGVALALAAPLAVVLMPGEKRRTRLFGVIAGLSVGAAPYLLFRHFLSLGNMPYPKPDARTVVFVPVEGQSEFMAFADPLLLGVQRIPERLAAVATGPLAAFGLLVILYAAIKKRDPLATATLCFSAAMVAALVPLHFEARYYLFAVPPLIIASVLGGEHVGKALQLPPIIARMVTLLWSAWLGGSGVTYTLAESARELGIEAEMQQICQTILAHPGSEHLLVGTNPWSYSYSRFRGCPRPSTQTSRMILVPAYDPAGLDYYLQPAGTQVPPGGTKVGEYFSTSIIRLPTSPLGDGRTGLDLIPSPMMVRAPTNGQCGITTTPIPAGPLEVDADVEAPAPLVAELTLKTRTERRVYLVVGRRTAHFSFNPTSPDELEVTFCAVDHQSHFGLLKLHALRRVTSSGSEVH